MRRTKTLRHDTEASAPRQPSKLSKIRNKLMAPFTRVFWEDMLEKSDDETLVDSKLLSYSYIEAGIIETLAGYAFLYPCLLRTLSSQNTLSWCAYLNYIDWLPTLSSFTRVDSRPAIFVGLKKQRVCHLYFAPNVEIIMVLTRTCPYHSLSRRQRILHKACSRLHQ
jgi:hypothetical protein